MKYFTLCLYLISLTLFGAEPKFKKQAFTGQINHKELKGYKLAAFPLIEYMTSFDIDEKGRFIIVESPRLAKKKIYDIRSAAQFTAKDFQNETVEQRRQMMLAWKKGEDKGVSERMVRIEDSDGDGIPDKRIVYIDKGMDNIEDGLAFSALTFDGNTYLTCIPHLWKFTDKNDDGVADTKEKLLSGFGVRISMMGHDMHGIIRGPDGRLYWSIGDRGFNVTSKENKNFKAPGRGAVFRCDPDGSNFEVFYHGLRNPQEIAFDKHGNLFTFDNTGDFGDIARAVYLMEGGDSGWHVEHQTPHQYRNRLDFSEIAPSQSRWVSELMFKPRDKDRKNQSDWQLPPIANFSNGPSGVTYLSGEAVPKDLQDTFLVCNYRGSSARSTIIKFKFSVNGAGFKMDESLNLISQMPVIDIDQGYDGRIYLADNAGGWTVSNRGTIQVLEFAEGLKKPSVKLAEKVFKEGFDKQKNLAALLRHPDMKVRMRAQFELVKRKDSKTLLAAMKSSDDITTRLHGMWGLAQLQRQSNSFMHELIAMTKDNNVIMRTAVCRTLGDFSDKKLESVFLNLLSDLSPRVRLMATIALGKCGTSECLKSIWQVIKDNDGKDLYLRHAGVNALAQLKDANGAKSKLKSPSPEVRFAAVLVLRQLQDVGLTAFLNDTDLYVRQAAIRAIYDKHILDGMDAVGALYKGIHVYSKMVQRRILFANFWAGKAKHAKQAIEIAANPKADSEIREVALKAILRWNEPPVTNPVTGFYRPIEKRLVQLTPTINASLNKVLSNEKGKLLAAAINVANQFKVALAPKTLLLQVKDSEADAATRISAISALVEQDKKYVPQLIGFYSSIKNNEVQAKLVELYFSEKHKGRIELAKKLLNSGLIPQSRAAIKGLAKDGQFKLILDSWNNRNKLKKELHLDLYLAMTMSKDNRLKSVASKFASNETKLYGLTTKGGNILEGKKVFEGQGACMQCHMVNRKGGQQGPALDGIGKLMKPQVIMESLIYPNKQIAKGFGTMVVNTKDGKSHVGRLGSDKDGKLEIILANGKKSYIKKSDIKSKQGPTSAMPAIAKVLPLDQVRDLVAYLESLKKAGRKGKGH